MFNALFHWLHFWSSFDSFSHGVAFEAISKVKVGCRVYLLATFTFDMASNPTPCEKLSKECDTDIANVEVLRCQKADTFANINFSEPTGIPN